MFIYNFDFMLISSFNKHNNYILLLNERNIFFYGLKTILEITGCKSNDTKKPQRIESINPIVNHLFLLFNHMVE